jgi:hypothetical protein
MLSCLALTLRFCIGRDTCGLATVTAKFVSSIRDKRQMPIKGSDSSEMC